jgi:BirA family biotin operon repressor/biotin-[acetyl-CoA-carboxylase] ligase
MNTEIGDLLNESVILQAMAPAARAKLGGLTLLAETDSTNSAVMRLPADSQHTHAVLAERQTSGRGRRQKAWHSPPGGNIYLSLGWRFGGEKELLSTLPLVVAIAVCQALSRAGLQGHGIKWPNDILVEGKKLAGILVELRSAGSGPALAVIGIGLNIRMPDTGGGELKGIIDRPWIDLASALNSGTQDINRNCLAALLLEELLSALEPFESGGFPAFREKWEGLDLLYGENITVERGNDLISGEAQGVDENGGLVLQTGAAGVQVLHSGEVSIQRD